MCNQFLKGNDDIVVTKADKGQVTVIMDKADYISKMKLMLSDQSTYRKIKKDPINKLSSKINSLIKSWHDSNIIDLNTYKMLNCTNGNLPRCYGLPKVHKNGLPLRIIVSAIGSPMYNLARLLHDILHFSIKQPKSHIRDGWTFANTIKEKTINANEIMVSLDVKSLFTNIPKDLVMQAIENRWPDISLNIDLQLPQFLYAVELILSSTCFTFEGQFYEQIFGSPMGSPLSPILADMVLEDLENQCLQKLQFNVPIFYRYVDDIFTVLPRNRIDEVIGVFNDYHPRLQFTYELERDDALPFLDTEVMRGENNKLVTNWYRKPTFSGRYVNFYSSHPLKYKINTIIGLVDRAILLSDKKFHTVNIQHVKNILLNNCFPTKLIDKEVKTRLYQLKARSNRGNPITNNGFDIKRAITLPYVGKTSEIISRRIRKLGLDTIFTVPKKLDLIIRKHKDKLDPKKLTGVVYNIKCTGCNASYIGQTKRHVETRMREHCNNIKKDESSYSVVSKHRLMNGHDFDWSPQILHRENHTKKREIAEMFFIKRNSNTVNLQRDTENLSPIYTEIIRLA